MKIGVFDSGLGGLLILSAITKRLPEYDYYYYGDTKNVPYGDKSEEEIYKLTQSAVEHLFKNNCHIVIIACNTASSETLRRLQDEYLPANYPDRRILGVIIPTIEMLGETLSEEALLLATQRTVSSGKYELELSLKGKGTKLTATAAPELVPLIESGKVTEAADAAARIIEPWLGKGDTVILGCTHYGMLKTEQRKRFPSLTFISQDEVIPSKLADYLSRHPEHEQKLTKGRDRTIHLTEHRADYDDLLVTFLEGRY